MVPAACHLSVEVGCAVPLSETVGRHGRRPPSLQGCIHGVSQREEQPEPIATREWHDAGYIVNLPPQCRGLLRQEFFRNL